MSGNSWVGSSTILLIADLDGYLNFHTPPRCQTFTGRCRGSVVPLSWVIIKSNGIAIFSLFTMVISAPCVGSFFTYSTDCTAWSIFQVVKNHDFQNQFRSSPAAS